MFVLNVCFKLFKSVLLNRCQPCLSVKYLTHWMNFSINNNQPLESTQLSFLQILMCLHEIVLVSVTNILSDRCAHQSELLLLAWEGDCALQKWSKLSQLLLVFKICVQLQSSGPSHQWGFLVFYVVMVEYHIVCRNLNRFADDKVDKVYFEVSEVWWIYHHASPNTDIENEC